MQGQQQHGQRAQAPYHPAIATFHGQESMAVYTDIDCRQMDPFAGVDAPGGEA
ncbi:hypothetical protein D3C76_1754420 [compost metagenome]